MEVSLPQIINTKKLTKSACSSRVVVQYLNWKILQFYKGYFLIYTRWRHWKLSNFVNLKEILAILVWIKKKIDFYHLKALKNEEFRKFEVTISNFFFNFVKFPNFFFKNSYFCLTFVIFFNFSWFPDLVATLQYSYSY